MPVRCECSCSFANFVNLAFADSYTYPRGIPLCSFTQNNLVLCSIIAGPCILLLTNLRHPDEDEEFKSRLAHEHQPEQIYKNLARDMAVE